MANASRALFKSFAPVLTARTISDLLVNATTSAAAVLCVTDDKEDPGKASLASAVQLAAVCMVSFKVIAPSMRTMFHKKDMVEGQLQARYYGDNSHTTRKIVTAATFALGYVAPVGSAMAVWFMTAAGEDNSFQNRCAGYKAMAEGERVLAYICARGLVEAATTSFFGLNNLAPTVVDKNGKRISEEAQLKFSLLHGAFQVPFAFLNAFYVLQNLLSPSNQIDSQLGTKISGNVWVGMYEAMCSMNEAGALVAAAAWHGYKVVPAMHAEDSDPPDIDALIGQWEQAGEDLASDLASDLPFDQPITASDFSSGEKHSLIQRHSHQDYRINLRDQEREPKGGQLETYQDRRPARGDTFFDGVMDDKGQRVKAYAEAGVRSVVGNPTLWGHVRKGEVPFRRFMRMQLNNLRSNKNSSVAQSVAGFRLVMNYMLNVTTSEKALTGLVPAGLKLSNLSPQDRLGPMLLHAFFLGAIEPTAVRLGNGIGADMSAQAERRLVDKLHHLFKLQDAIHFHVTDTRHKDALKPIVLRRFDPALQGVIKAVGKGLEDVQDHMENLSRAEEALQAGFKRAQPPTGSPYSPVPELGDLVRRTGSSKVEFAGSYPSQKMLKEYRQLTAEQDLLPDSQVTSAIKDLITEE